jgi:hypothetical protein
MWFLYRVRYLDRVSQILLHIVSGIPDGYDSFHSTQSPKDLEKAVSIYHRLCCLRGKTPVWILVTTTRSSAIAMGFVRYWWT